MHPNGSANNKSMIAITGKNCKVKVVCRIKLMVENARRRKTPFSQKPTCQPLVLCSELINAMFMTPITIGCAKYVIAIKKAKPKGGIYDIKDCSALSNQALNMIKIMANVTP